MVATALKAGGRLSRPLNLYEIVLPDGDVTGFAIDYAGSTGLRKLRSSDWLARGYDGVRLVGQGPGRTHMRAGWDGIGLLSNRHPGVVQLEQLTLHAGFDRATAFGLQNFSGVTEPKFQLRMIDAEAVVDPPGPDGKRSKWLLFGYNSDVYLRNVRLDATHAREHASYWHGFSKWGSLWDNVTVDGSGAENDKTRSDHTETAWHGPDAWILRNRVRYKNWYQLWSDRGGAALVAQNPSASVLMNECVAWGGAALGSLPSHIRSKCFMFSSEGLSYDTATGRKDAANGYGLGTITLRRCMARGVPGDESPAWHNTLIRAARNGGVMKCAPSIELIDCGGYGKGMIFSAQDVDDVLVRGCNTPSIAEFCANVLGFDVRDEITVNGNPRHPLSLGYSQ